MRIHTLANERNNLGLSRSQIFSQRFLWIYVYAIYINLKLHININSHFPLISINIMNLHTYILIMNKISLFVFSDIFLIVRLFRKQKFQPSEN